MLYWGTPTGRTNVKCELNLMSRKELNEYLRRGSKVASQVFAVNMYRLCIASFSRGGVEEHEQEWRRWHMSNRSVRLAVGE